MSILVLAIEKPFWQEVLIELSKSGADIGHAVVHYRYNDTPKKFFEATGAKQIDGTLFYNVDDISKLIHENFGANFEVLDEDTLKFFEPIERDYYILTDRFCYFPLSFRQRKKLFRESLRFWISYFKKYQISAVFASCTPHNFGDYVAYHVAKYLGAPTLQIAHTMINDYVLIRNDYREDDKVPIDFMNSDDSEKIKSQIPQKLLENAFAQSEVLNRVISKNDAEQGTKNTKANYRPKKKRSLAKRLYSSFFKQPSFKGATAMNKDCSNNLIRISRVFDKNWQGRQLGCHNKIAVNPDLSSNYIYFAMHLQPERTSTPEAELFEDHLLAIEILAKSLPEGWLLYVKENPRQFGRINLLKGRHMRGKTDYDDILRLPNVRIINQQTPSKELIENAKIVSTLSGSVGWEALRSGKPCIVFANAWYSACRSVFKVDSVEYCQQAIQQALEKSPKDIELDILKYLAFMQNKFAIGNMGEETYLQASKLEYRDLVDLMTKAILSRLQIHM